MPRPQLELTRNRAQRLCKMLLALGEGPQDKKILFKKLKVDERGFFRDLRLIRQLGIGIAANQHRYFLAISLEEALARLPVSGLRLSLRDALALCQGNTPAHHRIRRSLEAFIGPVEAFEQHRNGFSSFRA